MSTALSIDSKSFIGSIATIGLSEELCTAVSGEAAKVTRDRLNIDHAFEQSQSLFGSKRQTLSELWMLADACRQKNWDGEGALPVEPMAVRMAEQFIRVLPEEIPAPEFTPEPDGSVGLDWSTGPNRVFSISFGSSHRLAYAWLNGTDRGHAVARFDGETVPALILLGIRQIIGAA